MLDPRKFTLDITRWPLVVITQHVSQLSDEERIATLEETDRVLAEQTGRYALVLDNRKAEPPSAKQRALIGEYGVRSAERVKQRCVATALVVSTEVMRAMITAVQWQTGKQDNLEVFDELAMALAWTQHRLSLDRPSLPPKRA